MNTNPYKRNDRYQNHGANQKNGSNHNFNHHSNQNPGSAGLKPKGDKMDEADKPKRKN